MKVSGSGAATTVDGRTLAMKAAPQGTPTSTIRLSTRTIGPEHAKLTPEEFHARGLHLKHARKLNDDGDANTLMNGDGNDSMYLTDQDLQLLESTAEKVADGSATLEMKKAYYELALRKLLVTHTPPITSTRTQHARKQHILSLSLPG